MKYISAQEALCDRVGRHTQRGSRPIHGDILEDEESQNRPVCHLGGQTLPAMEEQPAKGTIPERNHQSIANTLIILFMAI